MNELASLEEQLRITALVDNRLCALIGDRWGIMLDTPPCVTVSEVSSVPDYTHDGDSGLVAKRYQLGLHASCVFDLIKLRARLEAIFSGFKGNLGINGDACTIRISNSMLHGKQPGVNLFYATIDLLIWHRRELEL